MALGIEPNNVAPQLIQNSGQALVQGIRQIGQQISGHLTELQTKRDLGGLAMEMQGVNPASTDFPVQLTQLVAKHPLAARDERGQMLLGILGKAHGQWQASQADALAFERQMKMLGLREEAMTKRATAAEEVRRGRPVSVPGVGLVQPNELDPVTGQPKVLVPTPPPASATRPSVLSPGAVLVDPTGKKLAENPKPATASTSQVLAKERFNASLLNSSASSLKSEIDAGIRRRDAVEKEQAKILEDIRTVKDEAAKALAKTRFDELDRTKHAIEAEVNEKKAKHLKIQEALGVIQARMQDGEGAAMLPEQGELPSAAAPDELVLVIDPNGVPGKVKASQLEAALKNGYTRR